MATLASIQSGNFTTASTWGIADSTSLSNLETGVTLLTTSFVSSAGFVPGAITISGIYIKPATRVASPTGTLSIRLAIAGVAVTGTTVTINVSDIPAIGTVNTGTWLYMKFASNVTLVAATTYTLQATTSSASQVNMYRSGTASDWTRALVRTTTAAPASTDTMLIAGEFTESGVNAPYTVTMDNTATTTWGTVANTALQIGARGTLNWGTAASTNYYFKAGGSVFILGGGTMSMGTVSVPMPSSSTATLEMAVASANQFNIQRRSMGTFVTYGVAKKVFELLDTSAAAAATSLTIASSNPAGWASGDEIVFAPTTNSQSQFDQRIINTISGTSLTITAGLANAKNIVGGAEFVDCEIINLTRNVRIISTSITFTTAIVDTFIGTTSFYNTEFKSVQRLPSITAGSSYYANGCSTWELSSFTFAYSGSNLQGVLVENSVFFNIAGINVFTTGGAAGGVNFRFFNCVAIRGTSGTQGFFAANFGGLEVENCRIIGGGNSNITVGNNTATVNPIYINNCILKSGTGLTFSLAYLNQELAPVVCENLRIYHSASTGINMSTCQNAIVRNSIVYNCAATTGAISINSSSGCIIRNVAVSAGTAAGPTTIGIGLNGVLVGNTVRNCTFGVLSTHATSDIRFTSANGQDVVQLFENCVFASPTELTLQASMNQSSLIKSARHNQTNGVHKVFLRAGTQSSDSVIFDTTTPGTKSVRLTPLSTIYKLTSTLRSVAAKSGSFVTVSVKVRKSVVGDGIAYIGNQPRLMLQANTASHIEVFDTVIATATNAANGAFETISGTIPTALIDDAGLSFYVDCDGTAGWVNIDSWRIT